MMHVNAFENLLCAFYSRPFDLRSPSELELMTQIADYYCALPALSHSLNAVLPYCVEFCGKIRENALTLLQLSVKLRNRLLYQECLIYVLGPWSQPAYLQIEDELVRKYADAAHAQICRKIAAPEIQSIFIIGPGLHYQNFWQVAVDCTTNRTGTGFRMPEFCRTLHSSYGSASHYGRTVFKHLEPLLSNHLKLSHGQIAATGEDKDHFFCLLIGEDDLPWDVSEVDW